ncbi:VOC family protein [Streptomyces sp. 549]|uniref:VOC family protein n=1 Tax=Streptomyces sp. 549 TaxID=3049076 RepID=UPI0024C27D91|nr:VOC family protein [Streptomyces sp. 549]MDK1474571.1 VOC family protein [Streptomyces sp. 549]
MFGNLTVTKMHCKDVEAMTAFYRDRLKMEIIEQSEVHTVFATGNGGELIITSQSADRPISVAFTDVDIPHAHRALSDAGAGELIPHKDGERFQLEDPEGNTVIFVNA